MNNMPIYEKECEMEFLVKASYRECWRRLMDAIASLKDEDLHLLSNPFLIKPLPAYRKAKIKVLFVGQETRGWDSFDKTLITYSRGTAEENREDIIEYLQWMYEDLRTRRKWDHTPYWRGIRRLYQAISPGEGDDGFLNTQLIRIDYDKQRPPHFIEDLLQREYNVLPMEIEALSPEVIVFLTGPYYDERLRETFRRYKLHSPLIFEQVSGFKENELVRISYPAFPYHTYRTYHPNYLLRNKHNLIERIESALKLLVEQV